MICPHCGYERKKEDAIISAAECPKCGIIYSKWDDNPKANKHTVPDINPEKSIEEKNASRKVNTERFLIYAGIVIILMILLHALVAPALIKLIKSKKDTLVMNIHGNPSVENSQSVNHEDQQIQSTVSRRTPESPALRKELTISDIIRINRESVVVVKTPSAIGSGFFINRDGHIATNKHVLQNVSRAEIKTINGRVFQIRQIIHEDTDGDLVIASTDAPPQESKAVSINAELPEAGEKIIVIGNPLGLEQTVSDGIVSAIRRNNKSVEYIQITAPVSSGNSGGPLLNMRGEVIGVATFQYRAGQNLNFCVAASRIISMQKPEPSSSINHAEGDLQTPQRKDIYCYADANGQVFFVDWRTDMLLTRPDGSLDRIRYEKWVLEQVGGNPDTINPEKEAREDVERNREELFKSVFPHRSMSDTNLTDAEKEWLERRYRRHYVEVYNQWMSRRNDAVRKYNSMMNEFDRFSAARR